MNAGEMDTKIRIESPTTTPNDLGDPVVSYALLQNPWAKMVHMRGGELVAAKQRVAEAETKFVVWHCQALANLTAQHRIVQGSNVYDILEALPVPAGRPVKIEILAKRRAD